MGKLSPLRRRMIEDIRVPQSFTSDARSLRPRGREVEPLFWSIAGSLEPGGRAGLPGLPGLAGQRMVDSEPDGVRTALLLRGDARPREDAEAPCLRARAEQARGGAQRKRGRAFSCGGAEREKPGCTDDGLCRRAARVGGGQPQDHRHRQRANDGSGRRFMPETLGRKGNRGRQRLRLARRQV